jgi:hypothetical protein
MRKPDEATPAVAADTESRSQQDSAPDAGIFDALLEGKKGAATWPVGEAFVVECMDAHHPTLQGRALVRWESPGREAVEAWVPTLHGLAIRKGDRLLLQTPCGANEPIVMGVIDGFLPRPEPARVVGTQLELKPDEVFQVRTEDGQPLIEVIRDAAGPVVRLLQSDTRLELQGKLSITAAELELKASNGQVRIEASDDVNLVGELIHLN